MCVSNSLIERFIREGVVVYFVPIFSLEKRKSIVAERFFFILGADRKL